MSRKLVSRNVFAIILGVSMMVGALGTSAFSQRASRSNRETALAMLDVVAADVRKNYYDPEMHGLDLDAKVRQAKEEIEKAPSLEVAYLQIAAVLEALNDSHTYFMSPGFTQKYDYGWRFQMVGNRCYVTHVRPGSDAEAKGIKPGDQVLTLNGFGPNRETLWKMEYVLEALSPMRVLPVEVLSPSKKVLQVDIRARVRQTRVIRDIDDDVGRDKWRMRLDAEEAARMARARNAELGPELMIVKLPKFSQPELEIEGMIDKARKHSALIVDLRGNQGGVEESLKHWLGGLFANDVKIADRKERTKTTIVTAKSDRHHVFSGKLIVLVDSRCASAAELFARVVQIEKRGTVLGDHTSGATMEARVAYHTTGQNPSYAYGAMVTQAELVMADGKSLEHLGVTPDETLLPLAMDMANGSDPVMAHAAAMAGVKLDPASAGKLFPFEWPKEVGF
jgi:carboxyl-terminal processing protease